MYEKNYKKPTPPSPPEYNKFACLYMAYMIAVLVKKGHTYVQYVFC